MAKKIAFSAAMIDALQGDVVSDPLTPGSVLEVLASGKKRWRYRRQVAGKKVVTTLFGGLFPAFPISVAREWARTLNEQVEAGNDPREVARDTKLRDSMTVAKAHTLYMEAVRQGRSSRAKRVNKPRTIKDKLEIYNRDIAPKLASRSIYGVTEKDLTRLIEAKGTSLTGTSSTDGVEQQDWPARGPEPNCRRQTQVLQP